MSIEEDLRQQGKTEEKNPYEDESAVTRWEKLREIIHYFPTKSDLYLKTQEKIESRKAFSLETALTDEERTEVQSYTASRDKPEFRELLFHKLSLLLQTAPITESYRSYLVKRATDSYDTGITFFPNGQRDITSHLPNYGIATENGGIFDSKEAKVIEGSELAREDSRLNRALQIETDQEKVGQIVKQKGLVNIWISEYRTLHGTLPPSVQ